MSADPGAAGGGAVGAGRGQAENAASAHLVGPRQRVGAVRAARLGAGHAVVEALEQPRLEAAGIAGTGQALQHARRRRLRRPPAGRRRGRAPPAGRWRAGPRPPRAASSATGSASTGGSGSSGSTRVQPPSGRRVGRGRRRGLHHTAVAAYTRSCVLRDLAALSPRRGRSPGGARPRRAEPGRRGCPGAAGVAAGR